MNKDFRVDFMIVGAQKCGTTTLTKILGIHPSIVCCDKKEPVFFSRTKNWKNKISDYHSLFRWKEGALHFEASTAYTIYPHNTNINLWESLYEYNPDLKIIYIVRHPIERVISSYMHLYERGYIDLKIEEAIVEKPILLNITRYSTQIKPFIEQFGSDNVQILFFDDLIRDQSIIINQLIEFLAVSPDGFSDINKIQANKSIGGSRIHHKYDNTGLILNSIRRYLPFLWKIITDNSIRMFKKKPQLSYKDQEMILFLLRKEIDELEEITDRDLISWRKIKEVKRLKNEPFEYHLSWYDSKIKLLERIIEKL